MPGITESNLEETALEWLEGLGYAIAHGPEIAPGELLAERDDYSEVLLEKRLREALERLNPDLPYEAIDAVLRKVTRLPAPALVGNNHAFHKMLVNGIDIEYRNPEGGVSNTKARLVDFANPDNNDWLAVNQFTVTEDNHTRRPDIVLFVNGLPLAVFELKNPADENATVWKAYQQLQTYKHQIPSLLAYNATLVISDGTQARIGSLTAPKERFMPWRTIEGDAVAPSTLMQLEVLVKGVFEKRRFLDLVRHFMVFEDEGDGELIKKQAGYHQFHAVNAAVETTVKAVSPEGDKRCGVVWHTQGSGKSLTMAFYAGKVILHPRMENPTLVVLTDRNDLDDQLFGTFARCHELLRQKPVQANDRDELKELLQVASGGVVFTTIQKFFPEQKGEAYPRLSERRNIVVIADEAHRSQYDFIDGFARHMRDALPNASFIGFTGTPIELTDKNTRAVFGDYVSIYDIQQAVDDKATVPIYYESRLAQLALDEDERLHLDEDFEEATEGEEVTQKEKLKSKWAALEALVGTEERIRIIAKDLVEHFEERLTAMEGKAMVVCMSRRICVALYDAIVRLRPEWHDADDAKGAVKVVMTGSAMDPVEWQRHIRNEKGRKAIANRFKNPDDPFKIVLVRDMWLTGFDVPCLHTMYLDKPLRGHTLMQAIARVNRVFRDKPGGLVVDYLGVAADLKMALANYTNNGGRGQTAVDKEEAVALMLERYEMCCDLFFGFDHSAWKTGTPGSRLALLPPAQEHILQQEEGKERFMAAVTDLSKAFALAVPHQETTRIRDDVAFFQAVRAGLAKITGDGDGRGKTPEDIEHAIRQIISNAVASGEVVDIFAAAGLKNPDISILSDEFLAEVRDLPQRNLAVELLQKLLKDEVRARAKKNLVQSRSFAEMLERALRAYQNRSIEAAKVIEELINLAKELRAADKRGEDLGLTEDEIAFYDALEVNDSAVKVLGDETLKTIAHELVEAIRRSVTIDWTVKESVRAKLRAYIRRILRKYGYPPDKQAAATETVLAQAELLCADWTA
ncbi:MAG TPA: type I restriction endonuclease subunit R [Bacillota bacterium]|nr:type I restriction endonuclease subunit R [Bacillota bacterium]